MKFHFIMKNVQKSEMVNNIYATSFGWLDVRVLYMHEAVVLYVYIFAHTVYMYAE